MSVNEYKKDWDDIYQTQQGNRTGEDRLAQGRGNSDWFLDICIVGFYVFIY